MQHAVDTVSNAELVFARLDVNVGCLVLDALADQQVDESNDGSVVFVSIG
jgi:hypothetical protein